MLSDSKVLSLPFQVFILAQPNIYQEVTPPFSFQPVNIIINSDTSVLLRSVNTQIKVNN